MILRDTTLSHVRQPVGVVGSSDWMPVFTINIPAGVAICHGKLQAKCYEPFAIEWCIALILDGVILNPVTGENVGPSVEDKYKCLHDHAFFEGDGGVLSLCSRARSTKAVDSTRLDFGNGLLQVILL